ncbi:hypothetical protein D3C75_1145500 [compost metagenome]
MLTISDTKELRKALTTTPESTMVSIRVLPPWEDRRKTAPRVRDPVRKATRGTVHCPSACW